MTPEQKLASIRIFAERAVKQDPNAFLSAQWLLNHIDFKSAPQEDTDMVSLIKKDMQLHAADCATNQKSITREYKGCTCWLENPNEAEYTLPETTTVFQIKPLDPSTKLPKQDFTSRQHALDWFMINTALSNDPDSDDYWGNFYDIKEKETPA